jgi:hypothetical protein
MLSKLTQVFFCTCSKTQGSLIDLELSLNLKERCALLYLYLNPRRGGREQDVTNLRSARFSSSSMPRTTLQNADQTHNVSTNRCAEMHGLINYKDTKPKISSLLVYISEHTIHSKFLVR